MSSTYRSQKPGQYMKTLQGDMTKLETSVCPEPALVQLPFGH
jgi:hypothetical protein